MRSTLFILSIVLITVLSGCNSGGNKSYEFKGESIYDLPERGFAKGEEPDKIPTSLEVEGFNIQGDQLTTTIQMAGETTEVSNATLSTHHEGYVAEKDTESLYYQLVVSNSEQFPRMVSEPMDSEKYVRVVYFDRINRDLTIVEGDVPEQLQRQLDQVEQQSLEEKTHIGFGYKIVGPRLVE
ncbi:hypothetical protein H0266_14630 [Halobacillus locisalis]|uniref:Uncharacterized protein n=1 Tax=Halobacillus locisalis TaxID=220753 RepID=A0A838CWB5_9BACI|nr:hypothetical protein [Halobacillus locisalis]MBA2176129.1 hypothetical protein [Halobacillus locisalis]